MSTEKKSEKPKESDLTLHPYKEPGETAGEREGRAPTGEKLEDINTKEKELGGLKKSQRAMAIGSQTGAVLIFR